MMMQDHNNAARRCLRWVRSMSAALAVCAGASFGMHGYASSAWAQASTQSPAAPANTAPQDGAKSVEAAVEKDAKANYTRTRDDEVNGKVMLELAIRTLKRTDGTGPDIHLVGAVHIADASFYGAMQTFLNMQEVVLYEGVRPAGSDAIDANATNEERASVTRDRMKLLARLAERGHARTGEWPQTLEQLFESEPRMAKVLGSMKLDGWNHPITLRVAPVPSDRDGSPIGESTIALVSLGSDSKPGGEDGAADIEQVINAKPAGGANAAPAKDPKNMQQQLADALGLEFQLDRIDTSGKAWRNSDMAVDEVQRRLKKSGAESEVLFAMLDGSSPMAKLAGMLLGFVKMSPQMRTMTTVMMIEVLSKAESLADTDKPELNDDGTPKPPKKRAGGMMGGMEQLRPMMQVILHDRNAIVAKGLKDIVAKEPNVKSIAAFYGAAHMPDLEAQLVKELDLKLVNETWTPAITVDLKKAGSSFAEVKQIRRMIQQQMK